MYQIKLLESAYNDRTTIPDGEIYQQIKSTITGLAEDPRPGNSTELQVQLVKLGWQSRKIRINAWRILYAVDDTAEQVVVLAIKPKGDDPRSDRADLLGDWEYHYC